jgi:glutamate synthase domain-containing protein 2
MRRVRRFALLGALSVSALAADADLAGAQQASEAGGPRGGGPPRAQMEQQLRRRLWQIAKQRVGFTDAQMTQLERTSRQYDERRRALAVEERAQRVTLRQQLLLADGGANQDEVAKALDRLHQLQRERIDLQIAEQREFATFMTPVQRARYAALQEQLRHRVDSLRRARPDSMVGRRR